MKQSIFNSALRLTLLTLFVSTLHSCIYINTRDNDIPPRGVTSKEIDLINFDGISLGNAFVIHVSQGNEFQIRATGELNDLDDLDARVTRSGVLEIRYRNTWRARRERMEIDIVMPDLRSADFSGASVSSIQGFSSLPSLDLILSGASKLTYTGSVRNLDINLSGASELDIAGAGSSLSGEMSGASQLYAFDYEVSNADLVLSGASRARVLVTDLLKIDASGASNLRYRGTPTVDQRLSGGSTLIRE
ncbi:GIN domain-containing protein [Arundinibacter roseus]|uniref:DUF2807 domain-containing protein n=1 Tax=Arundinibacter roseus TaxID=2070510 RepID=A0A4R4KMX8_9BACT|nr:DUF2807 domain-containing protein [Arundinibacter roseus]TDB68049.1 DUF2807 domain-containing protein [Arundinibacter roseus]